MLEAVNGYREYEEIWNLKGNSQAIHYLTCHPMAPICTGVLNTCLLWPDHSPMAVWGGWCGSQQGSRSRSPAAPGTTKEVFRVALKRMRPLLVCFATAELQVLKELNKQLQLLPSKEINVLQSRSMKK